jgi:hypothetical protein
MHTIRIDKTHAIVEFVLEGIVRMDEMQQFVRSLQQATLGLHGREIKIKADLRALRPASPEVAEMIRNVQEFGIRSGVKRVAEIVESDVVALQLNRVAHESGTDKILCRFWEEDSARDWLIYGGEALMPKREPASGRQSKPDFYAPFTITAPPSSRGGRSSR